MMDRTKWLVIPIAGLAAVSIGLGWWGTSQHNQRAAMATEIDNRYSNSFHELTAHVQDLHQEIGKARVSADKAMFQQRLRSISRLSSLAQDEIGKIPLEMMPMHETQTALADVSKKADDWLTTAAAPNSSGVQTGLDNMYRETKTMLGGLDHLQTTMLSQNLHWTSALAALNTNKKDNQIVDGFRNMDKSMGAFVETSKVDTHPVTALSSFKHEQAVSEAYARNVVTSFFKATPAHIEHVSRIHHGQLDYDSYTVSGKISGHNFEADVSKPGGHLLAYRIDRKVASGEGDFATAAQAATRFLHSHGFKNVTQADAYEFDHTGYFAYNPTKNGAAVVNQNIVVQVGLDNTGVPIAFNAQEIYVQPVTSVPARKYTTAQLRKVVNGKGHIEMSKKTIVLDRQNKYEPATSFYVTRDGKTYRMDVNAATGKEIDTTDLSTK